MSALFEFLELRSKLIFGENLTPDENYRLAAVTTVLENADENEKMLAALRDRWENRDRE